MGSKYFKARIKREFAPLALNMADSSMQGVMQEIGKAIKERAKENVIPNSGGGMHPGPHPHITRHEDKGRLYDAIGYRVEKQGGKDKRWVLSVGVLNNEDVARYATALEVGYEVKRIEHNSDGTIAGIQSFIIQYPWLWQAVQDTQDEYDKIIKTEFDVFFKGTKSTGKKGYIYIGPGDVEGSDNPV